MSSNTDDLEEKLQEQLENNNVQTIFSLADTCLLVGKSRSTLGQWLYTYGAPYKKINASKILISLPDLLAWKEKFDRGRAIPDRTINEDELSAKDRKELAQAGKAEFELSILKKDYVSRELVESIAFNNGQQLKNYVNALAERLPSQLIGLTNENDIRRIIQTEVDHILSDIVKPINLDSYGNYIETETTVKESEND